MIKAQWINQYADGATLDADQRATPSLAAEIQGLLSAPTSTLEGVNGLYINRRQVFRGKWIRYGGYYPKYMLKLFRYGMARTDENELLDFRFYVTGQTRQLRSDLIEENRKEDDIAFWIRKHLRFAALQSREEISRRRLPVSWTTQPSPFGTPDQRVLWRKKQWYRMPLYVRPFLYFFYRYVLRLGFLDGKQGFIFHFLQAFWYRLLVDINIEELRRENGPRQASRSYPRPRFPSGLRSQNRGGRNSRRLCRHGDRGWLPSSRFPG